METTRKPIGRGDLNDPGATSRGWGTVVGVLGVLTAAVGLAGVKNAISTATNSPGDHSADASGRAGLLLVSSGFAAITGGFALWVRADGARHRANVQDGFVPSRSMTAPWVWTTIAAAMSVAGVAVAATGVAAGDDGRAWGGAVLAGAGTYFAIIPGQLLSARISYVTPEEAARAELAMQPWIVPIVSPPGPSGRNETGISAGLSGRF